MAYDDLGKLYLPANGTEGMIFCARWCDRCTKDEGFNEQGEPRGGLCGILAESFGDTVEQWVWGDNGEPLCTAFERREEPKPYRCPATIDLFAGAE